MGKRRLFQTELIHDKGYVYALVADFLPDTIFKLISTNLQNSFAEEGIAQKEKYADVTAHFSFQWLLTSALLLYSILSRLYARALRDHL